MSRKRALIADTFCLRKRRRRADTDDAAAADVRSGLQELITLFSPQLFNHTLPPIVLKHQLYSLCLDKTLVDKQLSELRESGELLMFQLGFHPDAFALVFTRHYREKVLQSHAHRDTLSTVERFLSKLTSGHAQLSFNTHTMLREFLFSDAEITQLVKAGLLTVRDAGSWWLSIPNSGRFVKHLIKGRRAVLGVVRKSRYGEILRTELEKRRTTSQVKFHIKYHVHDIIGAELVDCVHTTSGTLLRHADGNASQTGHAS